MNQLARPSGGSEVAQQPQQQPTLTRQPAWVVPRANIRELKDNYLLELEMPGVTKDGLEITVENNELTIIGHKNVPQPRGTSIYRESRPVDYRRVFDLDPSIDTNRISAKIEQGLVTITLPKTESVKPRKIQVT